jgi:hypothetical protein
MIIFAYTREAQMGYARMVRGEVVTQEANWVFSVTRREQLLPGTRENIDKLFATEKLSRWAEEVTLVCADETVAHSSNTELRILAIMVTPNRNNSHKP